MIVLKRLIDSFSAHPSRLVELESRRMELEAESRPRYERVMDELHKLETMMKKDQVVCSQSSRLY